MERSRDKIIQILFTIKKKTKNIQLFNEILNGTIQILHFYNITFLTISFVPKIFEELFLERKCGIEHNMKK